MPRRSAPGRKRWPERRASPAGRAAGRWRRRPAPPGPPSGGRQVESVEPLLQVDGQAQRGMGGSTASSADRRSGSRGVQGLGMGHGATARRVRLPGPRLSGTAEHLVVDPAGLETIPSAVNRPGQLAGPRAHGCRRTRGSSRSVASAPPAPPPSPAPTTSPLSPCRFTTEVAVPSSVLASGRRRPGLRASRCRTTRCGTPTGARTGRRRDSRPAGRLRGRRRRSARDPPARGRRPGGAAPASSEPDPISSTVTLRYRAARISTSSPL